MSTTKNGKNLQLMFGMIEILMEFLWKVCNQRGSWEAITKPDFEIKRINKYIVFPSKRYYLYLN